MKKVFITHRAIYAYKMSFGLISASATNQRMMNKIFERQIRRNMEVYLDDMIVKSTAIRNDLDDLDKFFQNIWGHNMGLNPTKCTFRLASSKFLGYLASKRGIEATPKKIRVILDMKSTHSFKYV